MKRVVVAGGAGFIGSHLSEKLLADGYEVTIVDDLSSGLERNISQIRNQVKFIKCDIAEFKSQEEFDIMINLASRASRVEWETYPVEVALSNSSGNNNLILQSLANKALYIYASSSEIYGNPDVIPTPEDYTGKVSTTGTRSPYDEGKRFGEALVKAYEREYGLSNIIIRFFNTYGPRMRGGDFYGRVLDRFIQQALAGNPITVYGDGTQTRSFTYISDTVEAIMLLIRKGERNRVYNIGNDRETRIIDLASMVKSVCRSNSQIIFTRIPEDEPRRRSADITKIKSLGFNHRVDLDNGIRKMVDFMKEYPEK